ncbi:hypothetical protein H6P81_006219 [Aristolochia fimbriata]|uniref:Cytochrome P450 n=1 Tax=Aristolochia fimbriata TaxID=158543 RepID=A0AAV7EWN7_ARIFI|nr:hypothetical protein H6P81_006219 [Aristolochia fimbriata]
MLPTILLLLIVLVLSFLFFRQYYHNYSKSTTTVRLPPGPTPWPIVGNLPEIYFNRPTFRWVTSVVSDTDIGCIKLGSVHVIVVSCPKMAIEFLKTQDGVFASRPPTPGTEFISRGYLSLGVAPLGDQWKKMRRFMATQVLGPASVRWLQDKRLADESDNLVRYIYNRFRNSGGGIVNIREVGRQYGGNIVRKLLFNERYLGKGREDGGPGVEEVEYVEAIFDALANLYAFCVSDYTPCLKWLDSKRHAVLKKAMDTINKYHDPVIDRRLKEYWMSSTSTESVLIRREPEDILDVFISAKDKEGRPLLTVDEMKAQVGEFLFAAVDNLSNSVEWAMAEMLNQPDQRILRKAMEELDRVVGKERLVQESDIPRLNYVKACIRESLRLHPVAPFNLPHCATRDATVAGYFIPKGSHILLSRTGLGRNPNVWDDPLKFKPERHTADAAGLVELAEPDLRLISFTTGRRGCMGTQLGTATTVMLLARLLQGFAWSLPLGGVSGIDLSESADDLFLVRPLLAQAKPRLAPRLYGHVHTYG